MPKHDFGSPKDIANRIKAKGLQKLRWFCQMCQKQCRDENGFKCHLTSESHERQMAIFAESPDKFVDSFSEQFEKEFMDVLTRRFGTRRVQANYVYNEHIQQKLHTHMNSTMWQTLTDFVKYLGRTGKCTIDETDKGWFIQWINRDPEVVKRQEAAARRAAEEAEVSRADDELADLAARAAAAAGADAEAPRYTALQRPEGGGGDTRLKVSLGVLPAAVAAARLPLAAAPWPGTATSSEAPAAGAAAGSKRSRFDVEAEAAAPGPLTGAGSAPPGAGAATGAATGAHGPLSNLDRIVAEESRMRQAAVARAAAPSRFDRPPPTVGGLAGGRAPAPPAAADAGGDAPWLLPGIVVKVLNKRVGDGRYYKAKAVVVAVEGDGYVGVVRVLDCGAVLKVDQADLQTVVPARGGEAVVLRGRWRGARAELLDIHEERFVASLRLVGAGSSSGAVLDAVEYEDFSKAAPAAADA